MTNEVQLTIRRLENRLLLRRLINFQLTIVIVAGGECGDTVYDDDCLLGRLHKSVKYSMELLAMQSVNSIPTETTLYQNQMSWPLTAPTFCCSNNCDNIRVSLEKLGVVKGPEMLHFVKYNGLFSYAILNLRPQKLVSIISNLLIPTNLRLLAFLIQLHKAL
ncbi:hypothetical protein GBA52_022422 [Prunus armeniaca]|nr:hypothetical protein GBA52_022422 [Prunus armeniaca]